MNNFVKVLPTLIINIDELILVQRVGELKIDLIFKSKVNGRIAESNYYTIDFDNAKKCSTIYNKILHALLPDEAE